MRRTSPISLSVFALLFAFLFAQHVWTQQNRSSISGFVFGTDRRPVSQAVVELRGEFGIVGRVRTDGSGRFYFGNLAHGRYTVRVLPLGTPFLEANEDVEITGTGFRGNPVTDNVQKDIYLKPRRGADSIPFQASVVFAQEVPKDAEDHYKRAIEDLETDRTHSGIDSLEKAVAAFPNYFMALQRLGLVRLTQERFDDAEKLFIRALTINDRCFDCWYGLGFATYSTRKFEGSVEATKKAVEMKADSVEANLLLGMASRATKDFALSETSLQRASKISNGTSPDVHWQLALLYGKDLNKFAEAAKELEAYLKAAPEAPNKDVIKKLIREFKDKAKVKS